MSDRGVYPNEMNEPQDLDPSAMEALLSGGGRDVSPRLADLIGDMRVAYASILPTASAELSAFMGTSAPAPASGLVPRRFEKMRSSTLAKIGAATAALIAATGGLAVAHALPGPVQDAVSHLGIGASSHHKSELPLTQGSTTTVDTTTTTVPTDSTPTTAETTDNHGAVVSGVAHDHTTTGCDHGAVVSNIASDGRSQHDSHNTSTTNAHGGSCDSPTTTAASPTPTTTPDNNHGHHGATTPTSKPEPGGGDPGANHNGNANQSNRGR
jgi:hypothetical protein